jgi:hypothetical protein
MASQPIAQGFLGGWQNRMRQQDLLALQNYGQQNQFAQQTQLPPGFAGPQLPMPQIPQMQSQMGQQLAMQGLGQQAWGDPFGVQRAHADYYRAQSQPGPSVLTPEQEWELEMYGKRERPKTDQQREKERVDLDAAKQDLEKKKLDLKKARHALDIATSPEEKADREIKYKQAKADLEKTKKEMRLIGREEDLSLAEKKKLAVNESKAFRADKRIQNLHIIERSERGMQAALELATSPDVKSRIASDQALGVLFQKMLDPESVVRESEYARTPEGASAMNRLLAIAPQLRIGGLRLMDEDRQALVTMAQRLLDEAKITANKAFAEFNTRATELGLNKKVIFGGAKPFEIGLSASEEAEYQKLLQKAGQ